MALKHPFFLVYTLISICHGCFPNPSKDSCPTIVTGPMMTPTCYSSKCSLTGTGITITPKPDSCCSTATAMCNLPVTPPAKTVIQFNGGGTTYSSPKELTCDETTGTYSYEDTGGVQQPITSIECVCDSMTCTATLGGSAFIGSQTGPDSSCIYSLVVDCTNPSELTISFLGDTFTRPPGKAITCPAGHPNYFYINSASMEEEASIIDCLP